MRNTAGQCEIFSRNSNEASSFYERLEQITTMDSGRGEPDPELYVNSTVSEMGGSETNDFSAAIWVSLAISIVVGIAVFCRLSYKICSRRAKRKLTDSCSDHSPIAMNTGNP